MPGNINILEKATLIASKELGYEVQLGEPVNPRGTSRYHNGCRGIIKRDPKNYDRAPCGKCGKRVDTHTNAAKNVRDSGLQKLKLPPLRM